MSNEIKGVTLFPQRSEGTDTVTTKLFQTLQEVLSSILKEHYQTHCTKTEIPG